MNKTISDLFPCSGAEGELLKEHAKSICRNEAGFDVIEVDDDHEPKLDELRMISASLEEIKSNADYALQFLTNRISSIEQGFNWPKGPSCK